MSGPLPDPVGALRGFLAAQPAIVELAGGRVFAMELPESEDKRMPRACIVLRDAGGTAAYGNGWQQFGDTRFDMWCYGPSPLTARQLYAAARNALKALTRTVQGGTLLHWCRPAGGPIATRDRGSNWFYVLSSWQVLAAEIAPTPTGP